jgi:hypothetical protein
VAPQPDLALPMEPQFALLLVAPRLYWLPLDVVSLLPNVLLFEVKLQPFGTVEHASLLPHEEFMSSFLLFELDLGVESSSCASRDASLLLLSVGSFCGRVTDTLPQP